MAKDRKKPLSEKIKKAKAGKVSSLEKVETAQIGKKIETPVESVLLETNMVSSFCMKSKITTLGCVWISLRLENSLMLFTSCKKFARRKIQMG